jgi:prophage tail gpP-like protein
MALPSDEVTLEIAGQRFSGWESVRIVRGVELFPSHFMLQVTERLPTESKKSAILPGSTCRLKIGTDLVISGYVDTVEIHLSTKEHKVAVVGRSATEDLVDCAAGVEDGKETLATMTFSAPNLLTLANILSSPFGITVTAPDGEGTPLVSIADGIPQFTIPLNTSPYDVLEPLARLRSRLLMDGIDGNLVIAAVGTKKTASGFTLPGSVKEAAVRFDKQDRFSVYLPAQNATDTMMDVAAAARTTSGNYLKPVPDEAAFKDQPRLDGGKRYRPHFVVNDQYFDSIYLAEKLAEWEKGRRFGRSHAVTAVVPLWRDSAGTLWTPNTLAQVNMPALKLANLTWLISHVVYMKGFGTGTQTMVTLMAKEAFDPQPTFNTSFDPQISQAADAVLKASVKHRGVLPNDPNFNPRADESQGGV